jgi:hypothetical protein
MARLALVVLAMAFAALHAPVQHDAAAMTMCKADAGSCPAKNVFAPVRRSV